MYVKSRIDKINPDMKQIFERKFVINVSKNEIIKMKNSGYVTEEDMKIVKFLFEFRFATFEQIKKLLNEENTETVKKKLKKLTTQRVLNKFMLSQYELEAIENDALFFYCLDVGGIHLLLHYASDERVFDWSTTVNMVSSEMVSRLISVVDIYLNFIEHCPDIVTSFRVNPELRVGKKVMYPSFELVIESKGDKKVFIGEVVKDLDIPILLRDKVLKIENLLSTKAIKKYYYDINSDPIVLLIGENDDIALEASRLITSCTEITNFRVSSENRISTKKPHTKGAFLKYQDDKLEEISAQTFKPAPKPKKNS